MFLISVRPLWRTKTIAEYTSFLINQMVVPYYEAGTSEIHLILDKPGRQAFNPNNLNISDVTAQGLVNINITTFLQMPSYHQNGKTF